MLNTNKLDEQSELLIIELGIETGFFAEWAKRRYTITCPARFRVLIANALSGALYDLDDPAPSVSAAAMCHYSPEKLSNARKKYL